LESKALSLDLFLESKASALGLFLESKASALGLFLESKASAFTRQPLVMRLDQFEEFFQYQKNTEYFKNVIQQLAETITSRNPIFSNLRFVTKTITSRNPIF
jgi:hypothetical protein